jgi:hypothetical protein
MLINISVGRRRAPTAWLARRARYVPERAVISGVSRALTATGAHASTAALARLPGVAEQLARDRRDGLVSLAGGVKVDQCGAGAGVAHPFHQLVQARAMGRRHRVAGVLQVVDVQLRRADEGWPPSLLLGRSTSGVSAVRARYSAGTRPSRSQRVTSSPRRLAARRAEGWADSATWSPARQGRIASRWVPLRRQQGPTSARSCRSARWTARRPR